MSPFLQILVISPQNVDDDVLMLLADSKVQHLHLLQNRYTPSNICITACNPKAWRIVKRDNPSLCVHLRVESTGGADILIQPEAPVYSIMYHTPKAQVGTYINTRRTPSQMIETPYVYKEAFRNTIST